MTKWPVQKPTHKTTQKHQQQTFRKEISEVSFFIYNFLNDEDRGIARLKAFLISKLKTLF